MVSHSCGSEENPRGEIPARVDLFSPCFSDVEDWRRDLVEHSRDLLCIHDLEGRLLACNPAPARVLGYRMEELLETPMRELIAPAFREQFDAYLEQIARTGEASGVIAVVTRSGEQRLWEYHNTLRTKGVTVPMVRGIAHDVTERKHIERELRQSNQRLREEAGELERATKELRLFRTMVDESNDTVQIVDPETLHILDVNEAGCRRHGYSREEMLALGVQGINPGITPERHERVKRELTERGSVTIESVHRRKDGSTFPVEVTLKRVVVDREYVIAVVRDITIRSRALTALKASEAHFRMLVEQASDGIFLSDGQGRYLDVNSAGARMLGYTREEILQLGITDVVVAEEISQVAPEIARLEHEEIVSREWRFRRKDGSSFSGEVRGRKLPDGRLQAILRDVSERKRSEGALRTALEELQAAKEKLAEERLYLEEEIDEEMGFGEIVGQSPALKAVLSEVQRVAGSDATVLVEGETGTGKELVARAIHRLSGRRGSSFIKLNCAAIPSGLLESELFGHEKGAFTGAIERKIGRLELADGGTLFLDEIGEVPMAVQPKLLRVLQDQEFERLGSTRTLRVNFRLVVATNRDLQDWVKQGEFRSDLYYRLKVFPITVPPLRERRTDIPLLVEHFVRLYAARMKKEIYSIPRRTMEVLEGWDWPGNIRELENFVERSVILSEGTVLRAPLQELAPPRFGESSRSLEEAQKDHILRVLKECGGQIGGPNGAAARLGLKRTTLQSKLKQLGIAYGKTGT